MNSAVVEHAERAKTESSSHTRDDLEMSRLIGAAMINQAFCRLLLVDPARAIAQGFNGASFSLAPADYARIRMIRAGSLEEFAREVVLNRRADPAIEAPASPNSAVRESFLPEMASLTTNEFLSA